MKHKKATDQVKILALLLLKAIVKMELLAQLKMFLNSFGIQNHFSSRMWLISGPCPKYTCVDIVCSATLLPKPLYLTSRMVFCQGDKMSEVFEELQKSWKDLCISDPDFVIQIKKVETMLFFSTEETIDHALFFLHSLPGALTEWLVLHHGYACLKPPKTISDQHRKLIERKLIEQVIPDSSPWSALWKEGIFDRMFFDASLDLRAPSRYAFSNGSSFYKTHKRWYLKKMMQTVDVSELSLRVGKYPVAQAVWREVLSDNPSIRLGDTKPVHNISWYQCIEFCNALSIRKGLQPCYISHYSQGQHHIVWDRNANGFRLLRYKEWLRCLGTTPLGRLPARVYEFGWLNSNVKQPQPIGQLKSNNIGISGMLGNVWEWVWDQRPSPEYEIFPRMTCGGGLGNQLLSTERGITQYDDATLYSQRYRFTHLQKYINPLYFIIQAV